MKIATVVVTHNRPQLLAQVLAAMHAQTRPADAVFVIDNASDAETIALLRTMQGITVERSEINLGGTGGFTRGLQLACAAGFDWIWLLDDDAIPRREALLELEQAMPALPATAAALCGTVREFGAIATTHRRWFSRLLGVEQPVSRHLYGGAPVAIDTGSFVGFLVSAASIARVGLPDPAYFLAYDDTEFSLRLKRAGLTLWLVPASIVDHMRTRQGRLRASSFERKHYFNVRNRIVVKMRYAAWPLLSGASACLVGVGLWLRSRHPFQMASFCILRKAIADGCGARLGGYPATLARLERAAKN